MTELNTLPDNFRIIRHMCCGSGRGDELFSLALQQWSSRTERRGILRRKTERTGWRTIEVGDPFAAEGVVREHLTQTARLLADGAA